MSVIPFDAFWLAFSASLVASAGCLARLREHHRGLWVELGRPAMLPRHGLAPSVALTRFYWSARVARLGDPVLSCWVTALRACQLCLAGVLGVLYVRILGG